MLPESKFLGDGELKHALTIEVDKVSASAREKIDKAGGTITLRERDERRSEAPEDVDLAVEGDSRGKLRRSKTVGKGASRKAKKKTSRKR